MIWVHSLVLEVDLVTSYVNNNKEEGGVAMTDFREISKTFNLFASYWLEIFFLLIQQ